ncbi:insulinase family protein [Runella rosea]|uniref:Insulinase family protein n=1 Tax=Runella rosea TaxID=2259595 RepID=A0A344TM69_9BACT|nr:M16 family metallopeptidase [Runella rosea]AXE19740.1 insulinase family protein [Runella rosea]
MKQTKLLLFMVVFGWANAAFSQADLKKPIPFDPKVRYGKLPNGMTYYIRKNEEPKKRAELYLVNKVGAIQEEDKENGLAHFTEHMAFNGTKSFPKNELVNYLQRAGVKFGDDLNAFTGQDQTVYQLPVPTDSADIFNKAFVVLEDWAHNITMEGSEIDKERGVILEEFRGGKGAQQRMRDKWLPILVGDSKYGKRTVIGTEDILKNFTHETIRNFYKTWYRPDLQAILAVGDFDIDQVEKTIKERFGAIPKATNAKPLGKYPVADFKGTRVAIVTDPEQPYMIAQIVTKLPKAEEKTLNDSRETIKRNLFNQMLQARLQELQQQANPPFLFGGAGYGGFIGDYDSFSNIAVAKDGNLELAVKAVLDEGIRVKNFGFTATELERTKTQLLTGVEKRFKEKDKTKSASYVNEYMNHFLEDAPSTGIEFYYEFVKEQLNGIKIEEVNALAGKYLTPDNRTVIIMASEKDKAKLPTEAQILEWVNGAGKGVTAYEDKVINKPLIENLPAAGRTTSTKQIAELGVTELTLSNGVKVVLKPTDFKNDEILIGARSQGGTSLYNDKDFMSAGLSDAVVEESGVGEFSQNALKKYLTGKVVNISPFVSENEEGFTGSSSPKDLETALQLVYAYFTKPRKDNEVIKGFMTTQRSAIQNMKASPSPEMVFQDTLNTLLGNYNFRRLPISVERWDMANPDRSYEIYKERFADASDFTFFFTGSFNIEQIKPLLEKYLAVLPAQGKKESFRDLGIRAPKGKIEKKVYKGIEQKSQATLVYSGDYEYNDDNNWQLDALEEILNIKLIEVIREKESGVYGIGARAAYSKIPAPRYSLRIGYGTGPERVEELAVKTLAVIDEIKKNGATQTDIDKFKAETRRAMEVQTKENGFWQNQLIDAYTKGEDPKALLDWEKQLNKITVASTKATANKYLSDANFIKAVLLPEKK